jgi:hypothetical protein
MTPVHEADEEPPPGMVAKTPSEKEFTPTPPGQEKKIVWSLSSDPPSDGTKNNPFDTFFMRSPVLRRP